MLFVDFLSDVVPIFSLDLTLTWKGRIREIRKDREQCSRACIISRTQGEMMTAPSLVFIHNIQNNVSQ